MIPVFSLPPSPCDPEPQQKGLEWKPTLFGVEPRWTKETDTQIIAQIARKRLGYSSDERIVIAFFPHGAFNTLYKIKAAGS
jgi:hypothetical protein